MFIKVNANDGFNTDAVARWHFELLEPPPVLLDAQRHGGAAPRAARGHGAEPPRGHGRDTTRGHARETEGDTATPRLGPAVLTALAPAQATIGDPSFTLSVQGTNFDDGAVIVWNGSDEVTTFVSATEVTTDVDMSTAQTAAPMPVQVRNLDATLSNTLEFQILAAPEAPVPPPAVPTLTLTFLGGGELVLEGPDAEKVRQYYSVPSSYLTVL